MAGPWEKYQQAEAAPWEKFASKPEPSVSDSAKQFGKDLAGGLIRGAGSIGATVLAPKDMISDALDGKGFSLESNRQRRAKMDAGLQELIGSDPESLAYQGGKVVSEIAGTAGAGGLLAKGASMIPAVAKAPLFVEGLKTAGMSLGGTTGNRLADMGIRMAAGGATGLAAAGMIDPAEAWKGGVVGAALPPAIAGAGKVGSVIGQKIAGPAMPQTVVDGAKAAQQAGYVIPPTQVKPSLTNRLLEGFSGKITTAQNASARNQGVTNELAKRAVGATELTDGGLQAVRNAANAQYDALAQVGQFVPDAKFVADLQKAGGATAAMKQNFPKLVNSEVEDLVSSMAQTGPVDAQSVIEAIKQLRFQGSANKIVQDPAKKALGKAQMNVANALEEMVDRNLQTSGQQGLLAGYREARQTLAKVYDLEKALNKSSGNVDAGKLGALLKKGRPLTGELADIGNFANQFPKAAQVAEKMGSLPQMSPLDFAALGTMSAVTSNPLLMAGVLARPVARSAVLSGPVQRGLTQQPGQNALAALLANPAFEQMPYRVAPALVTSR